MDKIRRALPLRTVPWRTADPAPGALYCGSLLGGADPEGGAPFQDLAAQIQAEAAEIHRDREILVRMGTYKARRMRLPRPRVCSVCFPAC